MPAQTVFQSLAFVRPGLTWCSLEKLGG